MADVFISYKRSQRERVKRISDLLVEAKISVWFDASLEVGRSEGFDNEIEREVTSAACVVVCWTPDALNSIYVKAEAKKGLERNVLAPIFLEQCNLPVPFNALDTADLSNWNGDAADPNWVRVASMVKEKVEEAKRTIEARMAHSAAAYGRVDDKVFPGTLTLLSRRIAALHNLDAAKYQIDVEAMLSWLLSIAEKEATYTEDGYERADRQSGGDAWRYWDSGSAATRAAEIARLCKLIDSLHTALLRSKTLLELPAP